MSRTQRPCMTAATARGGEIDALGEPVPETIWADRRPRGGVDGAEVVATAASTAAKHTDTPSHQSINHQPVT